MLVEGEKLIREAVGARLRPLSLWSPEPPAFRFDGPCYLVPPALYEALSPTRAGQAPLAVFAAPDLKTGSALSLNEGRYLLLDRIQDPGNGGALIRAAVAFGFRGILWRRPCVYPYHHAAIRASAGTVFHVDHWLLEGDGFPQQLALIGAAGEADAVAIDAYRWPRSFVLAMGHEGQGLDPALRARLTVKIKIPIAPQVESLNVAGAAHILMYDAATRGCL